MSVVIIGGHDRMVYRYKKKCNADFVRCHTSSGAALNEILGRVCC